MIKVSAMKLPSCTPSRSVTSSALASRREKNRVGSGTSTGAPYLTARAIQADARVTVCPMAGLRDLSSEQRADYFRGIQPIWGGGLDEGRFQLFQRRLADAPESGERYRLLDLSAGIDPRNIDDLAG